MKGEYYELEVKWSNMGDIECKKYDGYRLQKIRISGTGLKNSDFMYMFDRTSTLVQAASSLITRGVIGWH